MARLFLSTSLGFALVFSSAAGSLAAATATDVIAQLQGTDVSSALVDAAETACSSGGAAACAMALQALVAALPSSLSPELTNEISDFVAAMAAAGGVEAAQMASLTTAINQKAGLNSGPGEIQPLALQQPSSVPGSGSSSGPASDRPASAGAP